MRRIQKLLALAAAVISLWVGLCQAGLPQPLRAAAFWVRPLRCWRHPGTACTSARAFDPPVGRVCCLACMPRPRGPAAAWQSRLTCAVRPAPQRLAALWRHSARALLPQSLPCCIALLGVYLAAKLAHGVLTFPSYPHEAGSLRQVVTGAAGAHAAVQLRL